MVPVQWSKVKLKGVATVCPIVKVTQNTNKTLKNIKETETRTRLLKDLHTRKETESDGRGDLKSLGSTRVSKSVSAP